MSAVLLLSLMAFFCGVGSGIFITDMRNVRELNEFRADLDETLKRDCKIIEEKDREIERLYQSVRDLQIKEAERRLKKNENV